MTVNPRFETLLAALIEGEISPEGQRELERLVAGSPGLTERVADAAEVHRLLEQELRSDSARSAGVKAVMESISRLSPPSSRGTASDVMTRLRRAGRRTGRPRRWLVPAAAAAAVVVAAGAALMLTRGGGPGVEIGPGIEIVEGPAGRGALLRARRQALVRLGGYARVSMEPETLMRVEGRERAEQVYLRAGSVTCRVDGDGGGRTFAVRTDVGTVSVTGTEFAVTILESEGGDVMGAKRMIVEVLVGAVVAAGAWGEVALAAGEVEVLPERGGDAALAKGRIESGKPKYLQKGRAGAWREKGRVVGIVRDAPRFEVTITDSRGREMNAGIEKVKEGHVYELWLKPGVYSMKVEAEGYEPLEFKKQEVRAGADLRIDLEFTRAAAGDEPTIAPGPPGVGIEAGEPRYLAKGRRGAWRDKGRIVGIVRDAPRFEVTVIDSGGRKVNADVERSRNRSVYEIWLKPGAYGLEVAGVGYDPVRIEKVEVRAGFDVRIDLEFNK